MIERVIRYVDLNEEQGLSMQIATTVEDGVELEPMRIESPAWLAVTHVIDDLVERHILYFLSADDRVLDFVQSDSMDESLAEAAHRFPRLEWKTCSVKLEGEEARIPRESIPK